VGSWRANAAAAPARCKKSDLSAPPSVYRGGAGAKIDKFVSFANIWRIPEGYAKFLVTQSPPPSDDLNKTTPYNAVRERLRQRILNGQIGHGQQLTPELQLCQEFNVSRTTIRRAIAEIVEEGLLERFRGRGTFVRYRRGASQKRLLALLVCQHRNVPGAYTHLIQGALAKAAELGYELLISNSHDDYDTALQQAMRLNELRVAGTIVIPLQTGQKGRDTDRILQALRGGDQHVVLADTHVPDSNVPSVCSQNREAMYQLTTHLVEQGYRKIAFLTAFPTEAAVEREEGYKMAMADHNLAVPPHYFLQVASTDPSRQGRQMVDVFMAMREPPEAIICLHDLIALNVLDQCRLRGWKVPQEVAVVGFDDLPQTRASHPPLTTMHQPLHKMGATALQLLIDELNGVSSGNRHIRLPCELIVRESSLQTQMV
jgi:GntR family transcriptional regulator of arabinose operon